MGPHFVFCQKYCTIADYTDVKHNHLYVFYCRGSYTLIMWLFLIYNINEGILPSKKFFRDYKVTI